MLDLLLATLSTTLLGFSLYILLPVLCMMSCILYVCMYLPHFA